MNAQEIEAFASEMSVVVREVVASAVEPLLKRIAELEARQPIKGDKGDPGERGEKGDTGNDGVSGRDGERGERGDVGERGQDGAPGRDGERGEKGETGTPGRDGLDAVMFLRNSEGHLIATMSNGTTRNLGKVDGENGAPGRDGKDGKDGRDGFGFDDFDVIYDGKRTFTLKFARAGDVREFVISVPALLDQGVFKVGQTYQAGDGVTWGGEYYIAQRETSAKPRTPEAGDDWRLAVRRGRDGKDFDPNSPPKPRGPIKVG